MEVSLTPLMTCRCRSGPLLAVACRAELSTSSTARLVIMKRRVEGYIAVSRRRTVDDADVTIRIGQRVTLISPGVFSVDKLVNQAAAPIFNAEAYTRPHERHHLV